MDDQQLLAGSWWVMGVANLLKGDQSLFQSSQCVAQANDVISMRTTDLISRADDD